MKQDGTGPMRTRGSLILCRSLLEHQSPTMRIVPEEANGSVPVPERQRLRLVKGLVVASELDLQDFVVTDGCDV